MLYMAPTSGTSHHMDGLLGGSKKQIETMSLEVTSKISWATCSHKQTVVKCSKFLAGKKHGRLLRLWRGTDSNKLAEEHIGFAGLWCCKRSAKHMVESRYVMLYELVAILNRNF